MIRYSCDMCRRELDPQEDLRYVVKMEVYAAFDPAAADAEDDDRDQYGNGSKPLEDPRRQHEAELSGEQVEGHEDAEARECETSRCRPQPRDPSPDQHPHDR